MNFGRKQRLTRNGKGGTGIASGGFGVESTGLRGMLIRGLWVGYDSCGMYGRILILTLFYVIAGEGEGEGFRHLGEIFLI